METPTVSVIIPAYNAAPFISATLDSVFRQTYRNFEVLVVNDGSPDTKELERALESYRGRITYLVQKNSGPGAARNLGTREARGEFVAFLDSDDLWYAEYLAEQLKMFEEDPSRDLVYCDFRFFSDTPSAGKTFMQLYPPRVETITLESLIAGNNLIIYPTCAVLRRKTLLDTGLFDETLWSYGEDNDLWLRIAYRGGKIAFQRKVLADRRSWPGSSNTARVKVANGYVKVLRKLNEVRDLPASTRALIERSIAQCEAAIEMWNGKQSLKNGEFATARSYFERASAYSRTWKLSLLIAGLRLAPNLTGFAAKTWQKLAATGLWSGKSRARVPSSGQ